MHAERVAALLQDKQLMSEFKNRKKNPITIKIFFNTCINVCTLQMYKKEKFLKNTKHIHGNTGNDHIASRLISNDLLGYLLHQ